MAYKTNYRPRIIDSLLHQQLSAVGGVLIEGPKQCGKTTTAEEASNSQIYMSDPTNQKRNLSLAKLNPNLLLRGAPRYSYHRHPEATAILLDSGGNEKSPRLSELQ